MRHLKGPKEREVELKSAERMQRIRCTFTINTRDKIPQYFSGCLLHGRLEIGYIKAAGLANTYEEFRSLKKLKDKGMKKRSLTCRETLAAI